MKPRFTGKLLSLLAAAALLVRPALAAAPKVPEGYVSPFSDVGEGDWFYPFVAEMNGRGVINGYTGGRFGPNDSARAGDAILMVAKAAGSGDLEPLQDAHYAQSYVEYAVKKGWLAREEVPDLEGPVNRALVARLVARALGLGPAQGGSPYADTGDGFAAALYRRGIMTGTVEGGERYFYPDSPLTRAEVSAVLWQMGEYPSRILFEDYALEVLPDVPVCSWDSSAFTPEGGRMTYAVPGVRADTGVDVSSHNGEIDWRAAAKDGVAFAVIRAGGRYYGLNSGTVFEDARFRENLAGAQAAGIETGVYFFSQAVTVREAVEEAEFLLKLLDGRELDGPVVFDWENIDNDAARTDGVDPATVSAMAAAFCETVEEAGYPPMIYFNQYIGYILYDLEAVAEYPFWIAQYGSNPGFYYDYDMWQYTGSGRVAGIEGPVDLNVRLVPWQ